MFRNSPSLGAQFVMSGGHERHSVPPADEALLEYWERSSSRSLKVIPDLWREPSILLRKWMFRSGFEEFEGFCSWSRRMKKYDLN